MDAFKVDLLLNTLISSVDGFHAKRPEVSCSGSSSGSWRFSDEPQSVSLINKWVSLAGQHNQAGQSVRRFQRKPRRVNFPVPANPTQRVKKVERRANPPNIECSLCKSNGESKMVYSSHVLKERNGTVVCPILRKLPCLICGYPGGDRSHTRRFCPLNPDPNARESKPVVRLLKERVNSNGRTPSK